MTREEMIDAIVNDVDNWDLDNIFEWIQHEMRTRLNDLSTDDIVEEYSMVTSNEY
ncbi:MAG: hypothetical protein ACPGTU_20300 [Myxococcota bacterium]